MWRLSSRRDIALIKGFNPEGGDGILSVFQAVQTARAGVTIRASSMKKKLLIATMLSGLLIGSYGFSPADQVTVYAQKKDGGGKRKDPVGPPVVRPKGDKQKDSPKREQPRKDKKPHH
jgi:hypothetical protein